MPIGKRLFRVKNLQGNEVLLTREGLQKLEEKKRLAALDQRARDQALARRMGATQGEKYDFSYGVSGRVPARQDADYDFSQ